MLQNKVPNVRFCKYLDIWKTTKLNRITEIIGGGTPDTKQFSYWNGGINWFSPTEVGKTVYLTKSEKTISQLGLQKSSAKLLPAFKTILFTSRAGIGDVGILTEESATNQGFQSLVVNEETDVYFLYSYSDQIKKYALKHSAGSTFLEISGKELGKMDLSIPSLPEQQAIGSFFRTLDDLLASYKDNLANYQSLKATMLTKMFPKAGHTVPEIRLDGFEGEWKFIKLGEAILEAYQGINTASDKVEYSLSGIPILQAKHITNGQINYRDTRYLDMDIYEHYISKYMPKKGEILFANIGTIGPSVLVDSDKMFLIAWNILKMSIKTNYSAVFIKITLSLLNSKHFFERITTGNATKFINKDEIMDIRISVPPLEEQQAIGAYFSNLDNLISSHQEKISQLEILKKKLLQDMFI